jgi:hypothetical protein
MKEEKRTEGGHIHIYMDGQKKGGRGGTYFYYLQILLI